MHLPILQDILILLGFAMVIVLLLKRFKLPPIIGFLITGVVIGPYGLSLINAHDQVEIIAEIGVILLLFVIGMELSIKQLITIKRTVFIGGFLQVALTIGVTAVIYYGLNANWSEAVFVGFLFSLSSTAIVLKLLQDRNEISAPHGRNALAILIFQDIIVVPMMLFTPIIAGTSTNVTQSVLMLLLKSGVVIGVTILSARYVVPKLMHVVAKTKSKELFLLTTLTICFAVAFLTSEAGLSLALGAFLAGLIISESQYSHQATSIILPFRELFASIFFISVGMLLDVEFFIDNFLYISLIVLAVLVLKSAVTAVAVAVLRYPPRTIILTGLALFQVGEFAFILSKVGESAQLLSPTTNQYFLAVSIFSMILTPFVLMMSKPISNLFMKSKLADVVSKRQMAINQTKEFHEQLENHIIIVGYGINGSNLVKAAQFAKIPYVVLDLNANVVEAEKQKGIPIIFGDATQEHMLEAACLAQARAVVVAISDPEATKTIIANIRKISQSVYILVRTRYVKETADLIALGADDVIPEEFETSVEIFSRVLHRFLIPEEDILTFIDLIRSDNYQLFKSQKPIPNTFKSEDRPEVQITCFRVHTDSKKIIGRTIKDLNIRANFGVNILAISRGGTTLSHLTPEEKIHQEDLLYLMGNQEDMDRFYQIIH